MNLDELFAEQRLANGYELIDGVEMHQKNGDLFHIPPDVLKRNVTTDLFVEVRIDSPRFSTHEDAPEKCECPTCNGEMTKPVLRHEHPASFVELPHQVIPSRGWGEDFWVKTIVRSGKWFRGVVDNDLCESRLHELSLGDEIFFHEDHILAVHDIHRQELVLAMDAADLKELAQWLGSMKKDE